MNPPAKPTPLLILGARPYTLALADSFADIAGYEVVGFVENLDRERAGTRNGDLPVHWVDDLPRFRDTHHVICGLGTTLRNRFVEPVKALGLTFATLIHPTAVVSRRATLGEGTSLNILNIVAGYTKLGNHVQVNRGATIGHHTVIGDYVTVGPGANIAGNCQLGAQTYVGIGATIMDGIQIGRHCVIGAGAVVTKDLPDRVLAVGVPARFVKGGSDGQ
jgi:sugar O-acyltransferase (sialic acid O-acetyltransferase NeuD family)